MKTIELALNQEPITIIFKDHEGYVIAKYDARESPVVELKVSSHAHPERFGFKPHKHKED